MINRIVLVTSAQPSANPRLIKEVMILHSQGFQLTVIWCPLSIWADSFDQELFIKYPDIKWVKAGYHFRLQKFGFLYARIRQKIWHFVFKLIGSRFDAPIKSLVLYSQELNSLALKHKADLYIGHNLGALPAIFSASKYYNAKSIFDFEDYHRGELKDFSIQTNKIKLIESKYIPFVSAITAASPAIAQAYSIEFPNKSISTINNCFPYSYALDRLRDFPTKPLKLFWFSQYIGKNRGLENVIKTMSAFSKHEVTLTLLGAATIEIKEYFQDLFDKSKLSTNDLIFIDPVFEKDIVSIASMHHIGLASEPGRDINNELALSNKIMMYLLAGNALICSDTISQKSFLNENPNIGLLYMKDNSLDLSEKLKMYILNPALLANHRKNALELAKTRYNWDIEQYQFLDNVKSLLTS